MPIWFWSLRPVFVSNQLVSYLRTSIISSWPVIFNGKKINLVLISEISCWVIHENLVRSLSFGSLCVPVYYNCLCFVFQQASQYSSHLPTTLLYKLLLGFRCRSSCPQSCSCLWLWINQLKEVFKASFYANGKQSYAVSQLNSHVFFIWVITHATFWFKGTKWKENQLKHTRNVFLFFDIEITYHSGAST